MTKTIPGYVIALTTFRRTDRYLPLIECTLDRCWPAHAPTYCLTDGEAKLGRGDTLAYPGASWTQILFNGLCEVKKRNPGLTHMLHVLDDHCPLRPCDETALEGYFELARRNDFATVAFPTYRWPWHETEDKDYPDGLVRTWRKIETIIANGQKLAVVPRDFFRYFQVQPAFWRIEYLIAVCRHALDEGKHDAWGFEAMRWDGAARHYIADYNWPTVHHGFIASGKVNPEAIGFIDERVAPELRNQLLRDSIGVASPTLHRVLWASERFGARVLGRLRNTFAHAER